MYNVVKRVCRGFSRLLTVGGFLFCLVAVSVSMALVVLVLYFFSTGAISNSPDDWGSFGSLLSGVFTFSASAAAIATLFAFYHQIKKQGEINESQLNINNLQYKVMLSDQFERHRNWFCDNLYDLEAFFENRFEVHSKKDLYKRFFPENRPDKPLVKRGIDLSGDYDVRTLDGIIFSIDMLVGKRDKNGRSLLDARDFSIETVFVIFNILNNLNVKCLERKYNGMVVFGDSSSCINIMDISETLSIISRVVNSILEFSDIDYKVSFEGEFSPFLIRDKMLLDFKQDRGRDSAFKIYATKDFERMVDLYLFSRDNRKELEVIYQKISKYFSQERIGDVAIEEVLELVDSVYASDDVSSAVKSHLLSYRLPGV